VSPVQRLSRPRVLAPVDHLELGDQGSWHRYDRRAHKPLHAFRARWTRQRPLVRVPTAHCQVCQRPSARARRRCVRDAEKDQKTNRHPICTLARARAHTHTHTHTHTRARAHARAHTHTDTAHTHTHLGWVATRESKCERSSDGGGARASWVSNACRAASCKMPSKNPPSSASAAAAAPTPWNS
jgi:hypothetical protein